MRLWLLFFGALLAPAAASQAQSLASTLRDSSEESRPAARVPNLRLVQQPEFGPTPLRHSGMVVETEVMTNGSVGLGLFNVTPRRPTGGEWRVERRAPSARKVGVGFRLRFKQPAAPNKGQVCDCAS